MSEEPLVLDRDSEYSELQRKWLAARVEHSRLFKERCAKELEPFIEIVLDIARAAHQSAIQDPRPWAEYEPIVRVGLHRYEPLRVAVRRAVAAGIDDTHFAERLAYDPDNVQ
jgi:hypothetical protein